MVSSFLNARKMLYISRKFFLLIVLYTYKSFFFSFFLSFIFLEEEYFVLLCAMEESTYIFKNHSFSIGFCSIIFVQLLFLFSFFYHIFLFVIHIFFGFRGRNQLTIFEWFFKDSNSIFVTLANTQYHHVFNN